MRAALGRDVFATNSETMQQIVGELLLSRRLKISAAESCTGGLVMARLTEVPGSSGYVDRGVVVYSNQSKTDLLGVPAALIGAHGAVSEPVAEAMARGMVRIAGSDVAVAVTGVAGPTGGTPEKPVGMVAIAAAWVRDGTVDTRVRTFNFLGGREMIRFQATQAALDMVRRWLRSRWRREATVHRGRCRSATRAQIGRISMSLREAIGVAKRHGCVRTGCT